LPNLLTQEPSGALTKPGLHMHFLPVDVSAGDSHSSSTPH